MATKFDDEYVVIRKSDYDFMRENLEQLSYLSGRAYHAKSFSKMKSALDYVHYANMAMSNLVRVAPVGTIETMHRDEIDYNTKYFLEQLEKVLQS